MNFFDKMIFETFQVNLYVKQINYKDYIEVNPEIRFGKPVLIGTRITVYDVLQWLASGMSHEEIIADFPQLDETKILACASFANYPQVSN